MILVLSTGKRRPLTFRLAAVIILLTCSAAHAQTAPKVLFDAGVAKYKEGKYQDAVDIFSELIMAVPDNAPAYKNRGVALLNLGKPDFAINDFTKAIGLEPDMKGIYSNLGAAWHYKEEYDKAIDSYDKAIKEEPLRGIFYYNRGVSKAAVNDLSGAIVDFEKASDLSPDLTAAIYARRDTQKRMSEIDDITFTVQTGAFLNREYAVKNQTSLIEKGFSARLIPSIDSSENILYLVRCGSGLSREEARRLEKDLKEMFSFDTFICIEHSL